VKSSRLVVLMCALVTLPAFAADAVAGDAAASSVVAVKGEMVISANGARLGPVYRTGADGSAQLIIDGKLVTVPASTLSAANGKLITSLTKNEVLALH
jgi:hypothetical protein